MEITGGNTLFLGIIAGTSWIIAGTSVKEETRGNKTWVTLYPPRWARVVTIGLHLLILFIPFIDNISEITSIDITLNVEMPQSPIFLFALIMLLFWLSFKFNRVEINKVKRTIRIHKGLFFLSRYKELSMEQVQEILVTIDEDSDSTSYRTYLVIPTKKIEIFRTLSLHNHREITGILIRHIDVPIKEADHLDLYKEA